MSDPIDPNWQEAFADRPDPERELGSLIYHASNDAMFEALLTGTTDDTEAAIAIADHILGQASPEAILWAAKVGLQNIVLIHLSEKRNAQPPSG